MSQVSHLGKMPNEILARIVQSLQKDYGFVRNSDLKACRLVDRRISAVATREFAKANFRSLSVVYSTRSLQTLANICAHTDLGAYVRSIWFSPFRTSPESIPKLIDIFKNCLENSDQEDLDDIYPYLQSYIQASYDEHNLEKDGQGVILLTEALSSLSNRGISVRISMDNDSGDQGIGTKGTFRKMCFDDSDIVARDCTTETANIIFQALFHSGCQVDSFEVYRCDVKWPVGSLIDLTDAVEPALESFAMLKSLELIFTRLPKQKTLDSLDSVLGQLRNLEKLRLRLAWDLSHTFPWERRVATSAVLASDALLTSLNSTSLQQVDFCKVCISEKRLVAMLSASRGSLKRLGLERVCLTNGCWNRFFSWLYNNFQLDHLELYALSEIKGVWYESNEWNKEKLGRYRLKFHGEEDVRSGLSEILPEQDLIAEQLRSEI